MEAVGKTASKEGKEKECPTRTGCWGSWRSQATIWPMLPTRLLTVQKRVASTGSKKP
jgi:hypothetical protein